MALGGERSAVWKREKQKQGRALGENLKCAGAAIAVSSVIAKNHHYKETATYVKHRSVA